MRLQIALFRLASAAARCPLTSPHAATHRLILQRHAVTVVGTAPAAWGRTVSGAVPPLSGCFSPSLAVLVRYRSSESVQPWRVVSLLRTGFHVPGPTWIADRSPRPSRTGSPPAAAGLHAVPLERGFLAAAGAWGPRALRPATPAEATAPALAPSQVWARALSLAATLTRPRLISPPRVLRCFSSPVVPRKDGLSIAAAHDGGWVPHSGIPGSAAVWCLPGLSRLAAPLNRLPMPRHPPCAHNTLRPRGNPRGGRPGA